MPSKDPVIAGRLRILLMPNRNAILILFGLRRWIKNRNANEIRRRPKADFVSGPLNGRRRRVPGPAL
jgi:hypothetical protein